jgi:hypothetical protein
VFASGIFWSEIGEQHQGAICKDLLIGSDRSFPPVGPSNVITVITVAAALYLYSERHTRARLAAERDAESGRQFIETHSFVSILRSQSRQALTKDLPAAIWVQTEELANRKNQLDGDAFPQQVGQVSLVTAMRSTV